MTKLEFIKKFAEKAGLTQKDAKEVTAALFAVIFEGMKDEDGVTPIPGVKFMTRHKEAGHARNPRTGEAITVPAKDVPKVKFGVAVKELFA